VAAGFGWSCGQRNGNAMLLDAANISAINVIVFCALLLVARGPRPPEKWRRLAGVERQGRGRERARDAVSSTQQY
jgi:hypothetical protein